MWGNSSERSVFPGLKAPSSVPTLGLLGAAERGPFCCPSSFRGQHPLKPLSVQVHRLLGDAACMRTSPHRCGPPRQIDLISNQQLCSLLYFLCYLELVWGLTFFFFFFLMQEFPERMLLCSFLPSCSSPPPSFPSTLLFTRFTVLDCLLVLVLLRFQLICFVFRLTSLLSLSSPGAHLRVLFLGLLL